MEAGHAVAVVGAATFLLNVPFGYWRAGTVRFSAAWFVAVHAPVPALFVLRLGLGLPFAWVNLPLFVGLYFGGQHAGARLRRQLGWNSPSP